MKLHVVTITLDGMPWLPCIFSTLQGLRGLDWVWHVSHGAAAPVGCTDWCNPLPAGLSTDGTTEFLTGLRRHPRVRLYESTLWQGKLPMVNAGMGEVSEGDLVFEMDSDELWTPEQVELAAHMFRVRPDAGGAQFACRYFVGPNLILRGSGYGNKPNEWRRMWRAHKGFKFTKHEPPEVGVSVNYMNPQELANLGLVFDHYAYATEKQVRFKETYYGYKGAVAQWRALQACQEFPTTARRWLPWIKDDVEVVRV